MKFTVKGYEIEITAKSGLHERKNKNDTMHFMNEVSCWLSDVARLKEMLNEIEPHDFYTGECGTIAQYKRASTEVFKQLEALGLYDEK